MTRRRALSDLQRRVLLELVSLMRDRQTYQRYEPPERWDPVDIRVSDLLDRCYTVDPDRSWSIQRRNQRQALSRSLRSLIDQELVYGLALAWCDVRTMDAVRWQGGGRKKVEPGHRFGTDTPNMRLVTLTTDGAKLALLLEQERPEAPDATPEP